MKIGELSGHTGVSTDALRFYEKLGLIGCAANLALQGGVKSADGKAVLAFGFSAESAAVRCTVG